jgi:Flp pilus assembly CpaE family ATPase
VVINRDSKRNSISRQQVEKAIKRPVNIAVPNDYNELIEAINTGRPLLPDGGSELVSSLKHWAQTLSTSNAGAQAVKPPVKKRFGILGI